MIRNKTDWEINISNLVGIVVGKYGIEVVRSVFQRYNATCFDNLNPCYYSDVFGELMQFEMD